MTEGESVRRYIQIQKQVAQERYWRSQMKFKEGDWVFTIQRGVCQLRHRQDKEYPYVVDGLWYLPDGRHDHTHKAPSLFTLEEALRMGCITEKDLPKKGPIIFEWVTTPECVDSFAGERIGFCSKYAWDSKVNSKRFRIVATEI